MSTWPASLPSVSEFVLAPVDQRGVTNLQPGLKRFRDRAGFGAQAPGKARVRWVMEADQVDIFEAFNTDDIHRGAAWFYMRIPITPESGDPEVTWYSVCRFATPPSEPLLGGTVFSVTAEIDIRDRFEGVVAVAPVGEFAFNSGEGYSPSIETDPVFGDQMFLVIAHRAIASAPVTPSGWSDGGVANTSDSSSSIGLHVLSRVAQGTDADHDMDFTVAGDGGGPAEWAVINIPGRDYATAIASASVGNINPPSVGMDSAGPHIALAIALIVADAGGANVSALPAGYEQICIESMTVFTTFHADLGIGWKEITGTTVDPGVFGDGNGAYGSGGSCTMTIGIPLVS